MVPAATGEAPDRHQAEPEDLPSAVWSPSSSPSPQPTPAPSPVPPSPNPKPSPASTPSPLPSVRTKQRAKQAGSLVELRQKYAETFIFEGNRNRNQIALTFDDAPDSLYTPQILDILKQYGVKATFFIVGYRAEEHPDVVRRIVREGHAIGNHSYSHAQLNKLTTADFIRELERTERILAKLVGYAPKMVRPPYGAIRDDQLAWLAENRYLTVNWNVDPEDWKGLSKTAITNHVLSAAKAGSIILMHSGTGQGGDLSGGVAALPEIIEKLTGKGYELVPLTEMLDVPVAR